MKKTLNKIVSRLNSRDRITEKELKLLARMYGVDEPDKPNKKETNLHKCEFCQRKQFCRRIRVNAHYVWACVKCWRR